MPIHMFKHCRHRYGFCIFRLSANKAFAHLSEENASGTAQTPPTLLHAIQLRRIDCFAFLCAAHNAIRARTAA